MSRNWPKTLMPASFKGFPFFVETESTDNGGRRVVTHEYVRGESHDTEDMGRKAQTLSVKGYLASDTADAEAATFLALLSSQGPGMLSLPVLGLHFANCTEVRNSSEKTKLGYVGFDLKFSIASFTAAAPITSLGARMASSSAGALASLVSSSLTDPFRGSASAPRAVLARAGEAVIAAADLLAALPVSAPVISGLQAKEFDARLIRSAITRAADVPALADQVAVLATYIHDHGAVTQPEDMQTACLSFATAIRSTVPATASPALADEQRLAKRIAQGLSLLLVAEGAAAGAAREFPSRLHANSSRAAIMAAFDAAIPAASDVPEAVIAGTREAVGIAVQHIDATAGNLSPLVRIEMSKSMPSTAIAWSLYRDPSRAPELVAAARTGTSLFMPTTLIAAAR